MYEWKGCLLIGSDPGEKRTSLTVPLWPGSLYSSLPVAASQITTVWSPLPAAIFSPLASQLAFRRFFSIPIGAPSKVRTSLSAGANGLTSHVLTVESMEFERRTWESGDNDNDVMVSEWPRMVYVVAFFLKSHTFISLSTPPVNNSVPVSAKATAVTGNSVSMNPTADFCRASQILK